MYYGIKEWAAEQKSTEGHALNPEFVGGCAGSFSAAVTMTGTYCIDTLRARVQAGESFCLECVLQLVLVLLYLKNVSYVN